MDGITRRGVLSSRPMSPRADPVKEAGYLASQGFRVFGLNRPVRPNLAIEDGAIVEEELICTGFLFADDRSNSLPTDCFRRTLGTQDLFRLLLRE